MLISFCLKNFSNNPKKIHKILQDSTLKIKQRQTITDFDKMQKYVKETVHSNKLGGMINKTARLDSKFDSFMNDFQTNDKEPRRISVER